MILHKAMKKLFIKFITALILKYQMPTIEYTVIAYEFILPRMSIKCSTLPYSLNAVTHYHLPVPHSVFGK